MDAAFARRLDPKAGVTLSECATPFVVRRSRPAHLRDM
jgi:hypothetical protein